MTARQFVTALAGACLLAAAAPAPGQDAWPSRVIKVVSAFPPGGSVDQLSRILAAQLQQQLKQSVIVENKVGASGSIGTAFVAKAPPDGYTLLVVFDTHGVNPSLIPNLPYDTLKDLTPITLVGTSPNVIAAPAGGKYKSFQDVLADAKANPGKVSFGSIGSGSLGHLAMTELGTRTGAPFNHVPYKGGGPLVIDAVAGHVPLMIGTVFLATPQIEAKKLVPLAVTSAKRYPGLPNVPTVAESGAPGFEALAWWAVFAPGGTPPALQKRIHDEVTKALAAREVADKLAGQGMTIEASSPEKLQSFVQGEIARWAKVVKDNRITAGE